MQPEFGSGLQEILFEPIDEDTQLRIENEIEKTMSRWLPYIAIDEINVDISDNLRYNNSINVSLCFSVADNMDTDTVTFSLNG
jgi:phage baseplate assembly protein W